jgi:hypothetical protein
MNYEEILFWVQEHMTNLTMLVGGGFELTYIDDDGFTFTSTVDSLIDGVLKINGVDLT